MIFPLVFFCTAVAPSFAGRINLNFDSNWQKVLVPNTSAWPVFDSDLSAQAPSSSALRSAFLAEIVASTGGNHFPTMAPKVQLPDTAHIEPLAVDRPWQGICWYQKKFDVPNSWRNHQVHLTLNGAMAVSNIVINGHLVGGREGGYLPVVIDLKPFLRFGQSNQLLVRLDNRDNPLVPPGKPTPDLDFLYYGGLYRDASLEVTPAVHITNPFLSRTPKGGGVVFSTLAATKANALVKIQTEVKNSSNGFKTIFVVDRLGNQSMASAVYRLQPGAKHTFSVTMALSSPRLWSPAHPHLYTLTSQVKGGGSQDSVSLQVGIRRLVFSRAKGLLVNGVPTRLIGTNRHQEYPYIGNALSDNASLRDMIEIKRAGFNCVRLSHYPQDPAVMSACDRLGLFAIVCAPGWQYYNPNPIFESRVESDIKDMVRWHRNHPSVLAWESALNETYPQKAVAEKWYGAAHSEFTESDMTAVSDFAHGFSWDWPYNQWNDTTKGRPQDVPNKPGYIREYGDWEFGGAESTSRQPMSAGEKGQLQEAWNFAWSHNRNRAQWPWTMGDGTWVMYDYHRGYDPTTEHSGMADVFRVPRYVYRFFQSQYSQKPFLYIANQWTDRSSPTKVVVFANGDRVKLYLNGKLIGDQRPDSGPDTPYGDYDHGGNPWDGGNARHLPHPPFTFQSVPYQQGELKAVSLINGKVVARQTVKSPGPPARLAITLKLQGVPLAADGADTIFVSVQLKDAKGSPCYDNGVPVHLKTAGPIEILGPSHIKTENGLAIFLIRSQTKSGTIDLVASSPSLAKEDFQFGD